MLAAAIPGIELLQTAWEVLRDRPDSDVKPYVEIGIAKAVEYYKRMDHTRAYVVALCNYVSYSINISD